MPTENRRVAAYLPQHIDEKLEAFKSDRGLKGDSQALVIILSEFFGVSQEVTHSVSHLDSKVVERLEIVESRVSQLRDELLSELKSELLKFANSVEQTKAEVKDELLSELKGESLESKSTPGQLDLLVEIDEPFEREIEESLSESKSELPRKKQQQASVGKTALPSSNGTLTTKELAERFGVGSSTLSHWKPTGRRPKTPEALLKVTRERDPDKIGWIYLPDTNRFQPERDIPSEPPKDSEGELLNISQEDSGSAIPSNQVSPEAPEGSERSGEG